MIPILLSLFIIVMVARLILRGYKPEPVLLLAGLLLMFATQLAGWGDILPSNVKTTGIALLDPFEMITYLFSHRAAGLGLMIMALMGFANYMAHIGANDAVVNVATKPLKKIRSPYVLLFFSFMVASMLQLAIPSATGLGVLLMGTMFPVMIGLGLSPASSAGVIATSLAVAYAPTAVDAIRGAEAVGIDVVEYVVYNQGPPAIVATLAVGITHIFWQRHCDIKAGWVSKKSNIDAKMNRVNTPGFYAILPMLPIVMAVASSELVTDNVNLNVTTIVIISMVISMTIELIRTRDAKAVADGFSVFLKGMGTAFATVVCLLVAAGIFAHGIKVTGVINELMDFSLNVGLPPYAMAVVFAIVTCAAAIIMGSGNAPFLAFVELIPQIAVSLGVNPTGMILPMQQASHMGRAMSPVSGVVIAVSSGAKLSPFEVVKRTVVPVTVGLIVHTILIGFIYFT